MTLLAAFKSKLDRWIKTVGAACETRAVCHAKARNEPAASRSCPNKSSSLVTASCFLRYSLTSAQRVRYKRLACRRVCDWFTETCRLGLHGEKKPTKLQSWWSGFSDRFFLMRVTSQL